MFDLLPNPGSFWPTDFAGWAEAVRNAGLVVAGIAGFAVAAWALVLNRQRTANDRVRLVNDTYVKAIEQLGSAAMEVRLGAIYALERIAATDREYHWPIMETLCAYIRERPAAKWGEEGEAELQHVVAAALGEEGTGDGEGDAAAESDGQQDETPGRKRPPTDIQAILTVFERRSDERKAWEEAQALRLDLRHADLKGAVLMKFCLQRADLSSADLTGASLWGAKLGDPDLTGADLAGANLRNAVLRGVDLLGADLTGAKFSKHPRELGANCDKAKNLDKIIIEDE